MQRISIAIQHGKGKVFYCSLHEGESQIASVTVKSCFRDMREAVLNHVVANRASRLNVAGKVCSKCGSLSEAYQTPFFRDGFMKFVGAFGDVRLCPIDLYADSTLISETSGSIHPICMH